MAKKQPCPNFKDICDELNNQWSESKYKLCAKQGTNWAWIGIIDDVIGSFACHYELRTYDNGVNFSVELHCEEAKSKNQYMSIIDESGLFIANPKKGSQAGWRILKEGKDSFKYEDIKTSVSKIEKILDAMDSVIHEKLKKMDEMEDLTRYIDLLESNKNLVLTGAPGIF